MHLYPTCAYSRPIICLLLVPYQVDLKIHQCFEKLQRLQINDGLVLPVQKTVKTLTKLITVYMACRMSNKV
jgi:hypothetical protein